MRRGSIDKRVINLQSRVFVRGNPIRAGKIAGYDIDLAKFVGVVKVQNCLIVLSFPRIAEVKFYRSYTEVELTTTIVLILQSMFILFIIPCTSFNGVKSLL